MVAAMSKNHFCSNCRFHEENEQGMECHFNPPQNRIVPLPPTVLAAPDAAPQFAVDVFFPRTLPNLSCGRWQPQDPKLDS